MPSSRPPISEKPIWVLKDSGSFASIHVKLPPGTCVNCESDAVVTFSHGIEVRGEIKGGLLAGIARAFLTQESFFTTLVENTNYEMSAEVMMAPSEPGGIVLHELHGGRVGDGDLLLTSGAYIASDKGVSVTSEVQSGFGNSLLSGTGWFLLRASGKGHVACGAYGAVHRYQLLPGETRAVDNGHLVAWSASMKYRVDLASSRGFMSSMTSGEALMCFFEGPGVIYLQSHKPTDESNGGNHQLTHHSGRSSRRNATSNVKLPIAPGAVCGLIFFIIPCVILLAFLISNFDLIREKSRESYMYYENNNYRSTSNNNRHHRDYRIGNTEF